MDTIEPEFMVFLGEGREGIGAVREVQPGGFVLYVENAGEFSVPAEAVRSVHDKKVVLDPDRLDRGLLDAIGHQHDAEDPRLAG